MGGVGICINRTNNRQLTIICTAVLVVKAGYVALSLFKKLYMAIAYQKAL